MQDCKVEYITVTDLSEHDISDNIKNYINCGYELVQILPNIKTIENSSQYFDNTKGKYVDIHNEYIKTTYTIVYKRNELAENLYGQ